MHTTGLYSGLIIVIILMVIYVGLFFAIAEIKASKPLPNKDGESE